MKEIIIFFFKIKMFFFLNFLITPRCIFLSPLKAHLAQKIPKIRMFTSCRLHQVVNRVNWCFCLLNR